MVSLKRKVMAECSFFADISMIFCSSGLVLQMIYAVWQMAGTPRFGSKVSGAGDVNCLDVALQISDDRSITWSLCSTNLRTCKFICSSYQLSPVSTFKSLQIGGSCVVFDEIGEQLMWKEVPLPSNGTAEIGATASRVSMRWLQSIVWELHTHHAQTPNAGKCSWKFRMLRTWHQAGSNPRLGSF